MEKKQKDLHMPYMPYELQVLRLKKLSLLSLDQEDPFLQKQPHPVRWSGIRLEDYRHQLLHARPVENGQRGDSPRILLLL
jgi:hypothetical protein